jgi:hypothetical protein
MQRRFLKRREAKTANAVSGPNEPDGSDEPIEDAPIQDISVEDVPVEDILIEDQPKRQDEQSKEQVEQDKKPDAATFHTTDIEFPHRGYHRTLLALCTTVKRYRFVVQTT